MANIPAVLEKTDFDALSEDVQAYFTEKDGKFYPNFAQQDIEKLAVGLRKNRDDILKEKREIEEALKAYKTLGTPEEIQARIDEAGKADHADVKELEERHKAQIKALREEHQKREQALTEKASARERALTAQIENSLLSSAITEAIAANEGNPKLLAPIVRQMVRAVEVQTEDGSSKWEVQVLDGEGKLRYADALGTPLSVKDFVAEMKADKDLAAAFYASGGGGTGAPANQAKTTTGAKTMPRAAFDKLSATDPAGAMEFIKAGGRPVD